MGKTRRSNPSRTPGVARDGRSDYSDKDGKAWPGLKLIRQQINRTERSRARQKLHMGIEPYPDQPRGRAKWDCW